LEAGGRFLRLFPNDICRILHHLCSINGTMTHFGPSRSLISDGVDGEQRIAVSKYCPNGPFERVHRLVTKIRSHQVFPLPSKSLLRFLLEAGKVTADNRSNGTVWYRIVNGRHVNAQVLGLFDVEQVGLVI
jgi:hypothetical protein